MPTATRLHIYSETLHGKEWRPDAGSTFSLEHKDAAGRCRPTMDPIASPQDMRLFGLLAKVGHDYRWSFAPRGMPADASPEVLALASYWGDTVHHHSWLTMRELMARSMEMLVDCSELAWELESVFLLLIRKVAAATHSEVEYHERRIIFWFSE